SRQAAPLWHNMGNILPSTEFSGVAWSSEAHTNHTIGRLQNGRTGSFLFVGGFDSLAPPQPKLISKNPVHPFWFRGFGRDSPPKSARVSGLAANLLAKRPGRQTYVRDDERGGSDGGSAEFW